LCPFTSRSAAPFALNAARRGGLAAGSQVFDGPKPVFLRRSHWTVPALPEQVGCDRDVVLFNFVRGHGHVSLNAGCLVLLLRQAEGLTGVLKLLPGTFMASQVVLFSVVFGAGAMGVDGKVPVLGGYLL
jgi:hypothetical protein